MSAKGLDTQGLDKILERGLALTHQYVNKKMGAANGIAPLDAYGRVPLSHLPASQQGELFVYFDRMESSITVIQAGSSESSESEGYKVVYSTSQKQFFLVDYSGIHTGTLQGYPLWLATDMIKFGTVGPGSVIPYTGKVYVCRKDNSTWVWDGSKLASFDFGSEALANLSNRVDNLTDKLEADRGQFLIKGQYVNMNGALNPSANYQTTGFITIDRTADITVTGRGLTYISALTLYDAAGEKILCKTYTADNTQMTIAVAASEIPEAALYFRACCYGGSYGTWSNGRASLVPLANAAKAAEKAMLIKRWNTTFAGVAGGNYGKYNPQTGYFEAFGEITDITDEQALLILEKGVFKPPYYHNLEYLGNIRCTFALPTHNGCTLRTPQKFCFFCLASHLEVLYLARAGDEVFFADGTEYFLQNNDKLRKVIGIINVSNMKTFSSFITGTMPLLEEINLKGYRYAGTLSLESCPKLSLASLQYLVDNSAVPAGSNATVLLHADVYAKLTDALIASAAAKRITFASAS